MTMNDSILRFRRGPRLQRGFSMFEVLVTLSLITVWLLATAGVQSSSLKLTKTAQFRTEAVLLASEIAERMEANKSAAAHAYDCGGSGTACAPGPTLPSDCNSPANRATCDLNEWGARLNNAIPVSSSTAIVWNAGTPNTYTITIGWTDRGDKTTGSTEAGSYSTTKTIL